MLANISSAMIMCGSNLLSYVPPSGLFHFFHSAKYICMWKVKNPWGVYTTFYFTVELSAGLKYLLKNSTMVPDASNLVISNIWVKFNVVHTPFLIFSLFAMMCILQNEKSEISRGGYVRQQIWTTHYKIFGCWEIFQVMPNFKLLTNFAVSYKFSWWGRRGESPTAG